MIFRKLFGKPRKNGDSMPLRLQFPPTPAYAPKHAEIAVESTRSIMGVELDYSPESLAVVDKILGGFHNEQLQPQQIAETVFTFGCYAGEVFVRQNGGVWKMPAETSLPEELKNENNTMVIVLPNGNICNPIGKAFKLLEFGEGESLAYFYRVFTSDD